MNQKKPNIFVYGVVFVIGALTAGTVATWLSSDLAYPIVDSENQWLNPFWSRFQVMFLLAVLIERSVETYLNATQRNGTERLDVQSGTIIKTDASQSAMIAALIISMLVALSGVRIIETLVDMRDGASLLKSAVWHGIDVIVSAGLMAGGADLFHQVAQVITGGLVRLRSEIRGTSVDRAVLQSQEESTAFHALQSIRTYRIDIMRAKAPGEEGVLTFKDGIDMIQAKCWWDKNNRIDKGAYLNCSKTHMASSGYEAIYLPDAVSKVTGANEIFLHHGSGPQNSLGCIAVEKAKFDQLWNHIKPLNGRNITVNVVDSDV